MTTSHTLAAMTDEQFDTHLLRQEIATQVRDMRDSAQHMDDLAETTAAGQLRLNADRLERSLNHSSGI